jgi:hypothetical protein
VGFTYNVYRLPTHQRYSDAATLLPILRESPPKAASHEQVAQWDVYGPGGPSWVPSKDWDEHMVVESNTGYPESRLVAAASVRDRCPDLDPNEWVVLAAWDMS